MIINNMGYLPNDPRNNNIYMQGCTGIARSHVKLTPSYLQWKKVSEDLLPVYHAVKLAAGIQKAQTNQKANEHKAVKAIAKTQKLLAAGARIRRRPKTPTQSVIIAPVPVVPKKIEPGYKGTIPILFKELSDITNQMGKDETTVHGTYAVFSENEGKSIFVIRFEVSFGRRSIFYENFDLDGEGNYMSDFYGTLENYIKENDTTIKYLWKPIVEEGKK